MTSQILVFALMGIAAVVAAGLMRKKNMWKWIIAYWVVLTLIRTRRRCRLPILE